MRRLAKLRRALKSLIRYYNCGVVGSGMLELTVAKLQVFFDIEHDDQPIGRIVIGLYGKTVPKVCYYHP